MSYENAALQRSRSSRRLATICALPYALLISLLLLSAVAAALLNHPELSPLTTLALSVDTVAKGGDWNVVSRQNAELAKQWTSKRPAFVSGRKVTAQAQSIDASMKWMQSAIDRRDAGNVHRAALTMTKAIHEIQEMPAARH